MPVLFQEHHFIQSSVCLNRYVRCENLYNSINTPIIKTFSRGKGQDTQYMLPWKCWYSLEDTKLRHTYLNRTPWEWNAWNVRTERDGEGNDKSEAGGQNISGYHKRKPLPLSKNIVKLSYTRFHTLSCYYQK